MNTRNLPSGPDQDSSRYDWERWWMPADDTPALDGWGMLHDPHGIAGKYLNPSAATLPDLENVECLILLGEPGMGKTTELEREVSRLGAENKGVVHIELGGYTDWPTLERKLNTDTERAMEQTEEDHVVLVLDGLDEAGLEIRRLADAVPRWLRDIDSSRLCLRLASRTTVARLSNLTQSLSDIWPKTMKRYALTPLTRADVELAAQCRGLDGSDFVDQVTERGVGSLAARPVSLELLLASASGETRLPGSRLEIYERGIRALAQEHNPRYEESGRPDVPASEIVRAAQRLATISLLAGLPRIVREGSSKTENDCVSLDDYPTSGIQSPHPDAVWNSALLVHDDPETAMFSHRSVAEFLAARFLTEFDYDVQRRLLADPNDREVVTPQLAGIAQWLSYESPDAFKWLVDIDLDALLNPDLPSRSEEQRQQIGRKIIEELSDPYAVATSRSYGGLAYQGMKDDLCPLLHFRVPWQIRLEAIRIAQDNEIAELDTELLALVDRATNNYASEDYNEEDIRVGGAAIRALTRTGSVEARQRVIDLAFDTSIPRYLRMKALPACLDHLDTGELCDRMDLTRSENLNPLFLDNLCDDLSNALSDKTCSHDPIVLVRWLSEHVNNLHGPHTFHRLANVVFRFALRHHNRLDEATWVRLGMICATIYDETGFSLVSDIDLSDQPAARHSLVIKVLERSQNPHYLVQRLTEDGLIIDDDLQHWLQEYAIALMSERADTHLVAIVVREILEPIEEHLKIAQGVAQHYSVLMPFFKDQFSPQVMNCHRLHLEKVARQEAQYSAQQTADLFSINRLDIAISAENWSQVRSELERNLAIDDASSHTTEEALSRLPPWQHLNETQRSLVISIAQEFLSPQTPSDISWEQADAIGAAAILLADCDPGRLLQVPIDSLKLCISLVAHHTNQHETCAKLLSAIADTEPEWVDDFVIERLFQQANTPFPRIIHQMGNLTSEGIVGTLAELAMSDNTDPHWTLASFLGAGLERAPTRFAGLCLAIIDERPDERPDIVDNNDQDSARIPWNRAVTAARALVSSTQLSDNFDNLFEAFKASTAFAADAIQGSRLPSRPAPFLSATPMQLARLALWARDTFPQVEIQVPGQVYSVDHLTDFAGKLFRHLYSDPTPDTLAALEYIAVTTDSSYDHLAVSKVSHAIRHINWRPPCPAELANVLDDASCRIVSTHAQLQELLVDTINKLNAVIMMDTAVRRLFWHRQHGSDRMYIPCEEEEVSDLFVIMIRQCLQGVIVRREVQVQPRLSSQTGQRIDIDVSVIDDSGTTITCLVEVKCNWNRKIETDITDQLSERYLQGPSGNHGIYLVAWYEGVNWLRADSRRSKAEAHNKSQLFDTLRERASSLEGRGVSIDVGLVDLTLERNS